ncbi:MAG: helix-turn-helix domain-containing protein [Cellvibrionaceae bacterium]
MAINQTKALIDTLKRELKSQGKTYADVAQALSLSEASVKRLFSEQNFTLQRLDSLCQLLSIDFGQLVVRMESLQKRMDQLSIDQEKEIADDPLLLIVAVCVINGYRFDEIQSQYEISEMLLIQKLAGLDRLKIIDLLPNNRIKLRVSRNFSWLANGPIQQYFLEKVAGDFFQSDFDRETEQLIVVNGLLSNSKNALVQEKMQQLMQDFNELAKSDTELDMDRKFGTTLVVAVRQWRYSLFDQFAR